MSFAPPTGPPSPSVPRGWKAQYDGNYKQWFFVNLNTGVSQWEAPSEPAPDKDDVLAAPNDPPPAYEQSGTAVSGDLKTPLASNNPYIHPETISNNGSNTTNKGDGNSTQSVEEDARLAAQLQAQENARAVSPNNQASGSCAGNASGATVLPEPSALSPMSSQDQPRGKSSGGGFFSKLLGRSSSSNKPSGQYDQYSYPQGGGGSRPQQSGYGNGSGSHTGYYPAAGGYGGGGGYAAPGPAAGYQGYPGGGGGYAAPATGYQGYPGGGGGYYNPASSGSGGGSKHGIGTAGALALGAGGGLLAGGLLGVALEDEFGNDRSYDDGYQDGIYDGGYDDGYNDGGDFGDF
ncbi:WW domain protein [Elaphomyces granulatus]